VSRSPIANHRSAIAKLLAVLLLSVVACLRVEAAQLSTSPLPLLDVPFVSQTEALCGGAAAAMVLRYWGERGVSAETFAPLVDQSAAGIRTTTLVGDLQRRGWNVTVLEGGAPTINSQLADGRPLIALIEDRPGVFHYVVVVGATDGAVIFHDPARAPLRVMARDEFDRRSREAGRWAAIVLPAGRDRSADSAPIGAPIGVAGSACDERVRAGVAQAQAGELDEAERTLTAALSCPGPAALRELAGVRLLQRRWDDVAQLSAQAVVLEPSDDYSWKLLGTSRFVLNQPLAALEAWNRVGEPRLDLVRVSGLERTRQRPVERMLGVRESQVISVDTFRRAERALRELPAARSTRLELVPVGEGLAELHATIVERGRAPADAWSWAAIGARAAIARTVGVTLGSLSGGGESLSVDWRFWPGRPRIAAAVRAPAAWPGTWGTDVFAEAQEFDGGEAELRRRGGRLTASRWISSVLRLDARGGAERWNTTKTLGTLGFSAHVVSGAERIHGAIVADGWTGSGVFGSLLLSVAASSARSAESGVIPLGPVITGSAGLAVVSSTAPLDLWPAGDTGQVRSVLARAHPLLEDGRVQVHRIGRRLIYGSGEIQYWWKAPGLSRVGAAVFADSVRTMRRRVAGGALADVDIGVGVGVASLLVPGRIRLDVAHGLRDGADALTVSYVSPTW
jgi:hypothetical protein